MREGGGREGKRKRERRRGRRRRERRRRERRERRKVKHNRSWMERRPEECTILCYYSMMSIQVHMGKQSPSPSHISTVWY